MAEEKKNYLDETMKRIKEGLATEKDGEVILESIRKELVQSFKNGIEVGAKRKTKKEGNGDQVEVVNEQAT